MEWMIYNGTLKTFLCLYSPNSTQRTAEFALIIQADLVTFYQRGNSVSSDDVR